MFKNATKKKLFVLKLIITRFDVINSGKYHDLKIINKQLYKYFKPSEIKLFKGNISTFSALDWKQSLNVVFSIKQQREPKVETRCFCCMDFLELDLPKIPCLEQ